MEILELNALEDLLETHTVTGVLTAAEKRTVAENEACLHRLLEFLSHLAEAGQAGIGRQLVENPRTSAYKARLFEARDRIWLYKFDDAWFADSLSLAGLTIACVVLDPLSAALSLSSLSNSYLRNVVALRSPLSTAYKAFCQAERLDPRPSAATVAQHCDLRSTAVVDALVAMADHKVGAIITVAEYADASSRAMNHMANRWHRHF